jgi:hypothetical protein
MNARLLINAILQQSTVLVAQLATSGGLRAPLAHIANEVFLDLARGLEAQGVSRKVGADMFGMALRAYIRKVQRLEESTTDQGRSLWNAVYRFLQESGVVTRDDVVRRFARDDELVVRGMLRDLTESGLVFVTGSGAQTSYRAATSEELARAQSVENGEADELLWAFVFSEGSVGLERLQRLGGIPTAELAGALDRLVERGVVTLEETAGEPRYSARTLSIPLGAQAGWEAAVYDHFQAVVKTIAQKLASKLTADARDSVGGSTFTFEVWPGHPLQGEVTGSLARFRGEYEALRERVRTFNDANPTPKRWNRVVVYGGQSVTEEEEDEAQG